MKDERSGKKKNSYERKNPRAHDLHRQANRAKNALRPPQRFLGVDPKTGLGLGWTRAAN
jgi:hypothetical protein